MTMHGVTLTAPRDALLGSVPTPRRRLRPYKGVTYRDGYWCRNGTVTRNVFTALAAFIDTPTDADHAALLALRDDPYEPVETLEDVVEGAVNRARRAWFDSDGNGDSVPYIVAEVVAAIRAHLSQQTPTLTAGEHIAALVNAGAILVDNVTEVNTTFTARPYNQHGGCTVLVLTVQQAKEVSP